MLEATRLSIGSSLARWHFRKTHDEQRSFTEAITSARQVLLVLPLFEEDLQPTAGVIQMLKSQFKEKRITVVTGDHGLEITRLLPHGHFLHLLKTQIGYFYNPSADFLRDLSEKKYDLAIDLNLDFQLPSGYICKASGALVRVGFSGPHADVFYNFQVRPDPTLGRKVIYDRLVQCLRSF
jgi:ADP-heptose:LPS heptosyltransferase